jgi:hypothetical protein
VEKNHNYLGMMITFQQKSLKKMGGKLPTIMCIAKIAQLKYLKRKVKFKNRSKHMKNFKNICFAVMLIILAPIFIIGFVYRFTINVFSAGSHAADIICE